MAEALQTMPPPVVGAPTVVRFAEPSDLEFLRQDGDLSSDVIRRKIEWREMIVAERDGQLVGHIRLEYLCSKYPYLALVHVFPRFRRRGSGEAMLRFTEQHLAESHDTVYCSLQADESSPLHWLRKMGFEECGMIAALNPGGIGEVFFRKRLRPPSSEWAAPPRPSAQSDR